MMWEALLFAVLMVGSCLLGLYLGWTARDRAAVRDGDKPLQLLQLPVKDPIDLPMWTAPKKEEAEYVGPWEGPFPHDL